MKQPAKHPPVQRRPDWHSIDTVLLDMDGTLLDLRFDAQFWGEHVPAHFARHHGLSPREANEQVQPLMEAVEGTLDWYCLDYWTRTLGVDIAALKHELRASVAFLPRSVEFLRRVRQLGKRIVLVTNAHRDSLAVKLGQTDLHDYLDAIHSSHDFGLPKEDAGFWRALQSAEPFDCAKSLFADDSMAVLRAAQGFGIRWVYAVACPDSGAPRRPVSEFAEVDSVADLLPPQAAGRKR